MARKRTKGKATTKVARKKITKAAGAKRWTCFALGRRRATRNADREEAGPFERRDFLREGPLRLRLGADTEAGLEPTIVPLYGVRLLRCRAGPRMVPHQERRARHRHDLVAARTRRIHLTARGALEVREQRLTVWAGTEPSIRHWSPFVVSRG